MIPFSSHRSNKVFLNVFSGACILSAAIAWVYTSYFNGDFPALLVYYSQDGWCDPVTQGLGLHCFGDYASIHFSSLFQSPQGPEAVYPLATRVFRLPFLLIESVSGYRIGLVLYLASLFIAIIFPVIHISCRRKEEHTLIWLFSVIGVSVGTLSCLDRGNVIGFAVPFLYLFLVRFKSTDSRMASIYLTIATMAKPQIALFAIAFLWQSEIKVFLIFTLRTFLLLVSPYLIFGSRTLLELGNWIKETLKWSGSLPPNINYPTNYSFNRILGVFEINFPIFSFLLGAFFLAGLSLPYLRQKKEVSALDLIKLGLVMVCMNSIVYVYYMVLLIPLFALLFTRSKTTIGQTEFGKGSRVAAILLASATAPLVWPSRWKIADSINSTSAYNQIPLVVTLSVAIYITSSVINNILNTFNQRNL